MSETGQMRAWRRFLVLFEVMLGAALVYGVAALVFGWAAGGPDRLDGQSILVPDPGHRSMLPRWAHAATCYAGLLVTLLLLYFLSRPDGWPGRIVNRLPIASGLLFIGGGALVAVGMSFLAAVTGGPRLVGDLSTVASVAVISAWFPRLIARAVTAEPGARLPGGGRGGRDRIGEAIRFMHGLAGAAFGGGVHDALLFAYGAAFFVGLGMGVSGSSVALLYAVPVGLALADSATVRIGAPLVLRVSGWRQVVAGLVAIPVVGAAGMVMKVVLLVGGSEVLALLGGPMIPWRLYGNVGLADPFGTGLTATILLLASLAWPLPLLFAAIRQRLV